jgi:ABC-type Na+ efflux pump permease subunit
MSAGAVRTIVRREVNDTLTDWRILVPIFILTFVLPQLLIAASSVAIDFVGDRGSVVRLIPFAMLLVGFIPASFSLITALESFVGERERNSLEALLSMPLSDNALYLGKLISSLIPPLMSSFLAMAIFGISLRIREPDLFFDGLNFEYLIVVLLLILAKSVVMVAGAVIISKSHDQHPRRQSACQFRAAANGGDHSTRGAPDHCAALGCALAGGCSSARGCRRADAHRHGNVQP